MTLTIKQELFVAAYCSNGYNATQAALTAGYSPNSAGVIGSENLSKPEKPKGKKRKKKKKKVKTTNNDGQKRKTS